MNPGGTPPRLVLASTSPYRRALLERLGVPFEVHEPRVVEDAYKREAVSPRSLAERLAEAKATSLGDVVPDANVIGSDQVVAFQGEVFGKPGDAEGAVAQLLALSGRTHELLTAFAVARGGRVLARHTDVTRLRMRPLDREALGRYVEADRPFDCAGSYKLERRGVTLFDRIESDDQSAVTGLPLIALTGVLRDLGYPIP